MAKMRVYELAKDLNMKPKALLEKISDMDIVVRSHASSLDDAEIAKIKSNLAGNRKGDGVDTDGEKPTVIRKPKKRRESAGETVPAAEAMIETEEAEVGETPPSEAETVPTVAAVAASEADASVPPQRDSRTEVAVADAPGPESASESEASSPVKAESKSESAGDAAVAQPTFDRARVIQPPAPPKPDPATAKAEPAAEPEPDRPSETTGAEAGAAEIVPDANAVADPEAGKAERPAETGEAEANAPAGETVDATVSADASPEEAGASEGKPAESVETDADADDAAKKKESAPSADGEEGARSDAKPEKRGKRKKRTKKDKEKDKDTPARIISLPPADEIPSLPAKDDESPEAPAAAPPADAPSGRRQKTAEGDVSSDKWTKKRISFKRKEVVDGADLYGRKGRKGKKGGGKGKGAKGVKPLKTQITTPKAIKRRIKVDEAIVLAELAKRMGIKANEMIKKLMMLGVMATVNQTIDYDTAALVASEFGYEVEKAAFEEESILRPETDEDPEKRVHRPPVVTIMGHVDHGKTSLLDVIRKTRVTEGEAGGITQHIGAYSVRIKDRRITFLDTPGHEAFTSMRARGATVTDIVILVVAADDGVMPQTVEAINHAKAAGVPIIVAVNKMDKPGADPERVMREISDQGLVPEDWGGDTIFVRVSAKQNTGIEDMLEMILLQSEVLELTANPDRLALGYVVEAQLDAGRGPVATILIQDGTLRTGDTVVCGVQYGKVRAMLNDLGENVDTAGPSDPVAILGLSGVPGAGDELVALEDEKSAKQVSEHRLQKQRNVELAKTSRISLEKLFEQMQVGEVKDLNVILKADVQGSIEALADSLAKLSNDEVTIRVIHSATGTVTESDVSLAAVSEAIIIGFNVRPSAKVQTMANEEGVDMRFYNIIYNVIKDVKDAIVGMMESTYEERVLGMAEVRQTFHVPKVGTIAGCHVTDGKIERGRKIRLVRDGVIIHEGTISSLKRFKDDMKEVRAGYECGIGVEKYNDVKVGDVIECFYLEEIRPEL
jgi:translation initiation factor IF-2